MDEAERGALEAPDGVEPNFLNPPNMNVLADGITITALIITALAVLVRTHFWVFGPNQLKGRLEAILVIGGFASYIGFTYCLLRISQLEVGWWVHQWDMTVGDSIGFSYWTHIAGILYNSAIAPIKAAIVLEWMRIFSPNSRTVFYWVCHGVLWFNVAYYIAAIIVESVRCTPRELIWNSSIDGTCLDSNALEAIFSINVALDIVMLVVPQFALWRLKLSMAQKIGVGLILSIGLFGTISAILRLVSLGKYLASQDSTYSVGPVCFWALGEMISVFIVYGLPVVPAAFAGGVTGFPFYCMRWTQGSSTGRTGDDSNSRRSIGPWREGRTGPSKRYKNLDRNSLPVNALDTGTTHCTSTMTDTHPSIPPESACVVVKTVEIRRDEIRTDVLGDLDKDMVDGGVLLRQHPWVKLG